MRYLDRLHYALLALRVVTAATTEHDHRAQQQVGESARAAHKATRESVEPASYADRRGYAGGEEPAEDAKARGGIRPEVVEPVGEARGFVLLPRRWVVERSFARATRLRRPAKDYELLPEAVRDSASSPLPA